MSTGTLSPPAHERPLQDPTPPATSVAATQFIDQVLHLAPVSVTQTPAPSPLNNGSLPTATLAAWTLAGIVHRERNSDLTAARSAAAATTTTTTAAATATATQQSQPIAVAPGIVVPATLVGHYTLTGPPSFTDQLTNTALGLLHQVSTVIGVELSFALSQAISSADPPFFTTLGLKATKTTYTFTDDTGSTQSWKVWEISPTQPTDDVVIAIHGGAFTIQPNLLQWLDYSQMARDTGATVIVPMYPLAQNGGDAAAVVPPMADFIAATVADYGADHVSIYADSAGGDIAMLAVQKIVRDCGGDAACLASTRPDHMVLLSPALSGTALFTDPNVALIDDPVESVPKPGQDPGWQGDLPDTGPDALLWDPSQGSAADLPATTIYVGTRDILAPDEMTFAGRMAEAGSPIDVVIGMGQIHDWALGGLPTSSQAPLYRNDIYQQLGLIETT
ncbi:alpha/beta hydrolase [Mycobacterium sp. OTB74]|uniref:alpha/beta hydrolase n=1 Tax=Mycobacterium sp. OTB74 TaxID=1853452 RepID=UPI0024731423|nr:alpha/beta hydrolase [Mycobacterium sp. OTB74]